MGRPKTSPAEKEFRTEVAAKFRQVMSQNNLTEAAAARQIGVTRQSFNKYLREETTPQCEVLARACAKWNVTLKYRTAWFGRGAFAARESKTEPEVLQMDLFREPQVFENTHLIVTVERAQAQALQVTIRMKKAALPLPPAARRRS